MSDNRRSVELSGDPQMRQSTGTFTVERDPEHDDFWVTIPDRNGHATAYTFSRQDWQRIAHLVAAVTQE